LSQLSVTNSNTSLQDGLSSSSLESGHLLDFLPAYSGVSFLKHQRKSTYSKSGSDNGIELPRSSDEEHFGDISRQCVSKPKLASEKSNLPKDVSNAYMLFASWEVRIVKNCGRGLENAA